MHFSNNFLKSQYTSDVSLKFHGKDACRLHTRGLGLREKDREKTARERVQVVDEYCKCVISLPKYILESAQVATFFKPTESDIDWSVKPVSTSSTFNGGLTLAPTMASEVYTVTSDFTPEASDQVKLTKGGSVSVLVKKDTGWWLVKTEDDNQGWVPATHLHSQLKGKDDQVVKYPKGMEEKFMVVKNYKSDMKDEVTLQTGCVVEVVEKTMDGWWLVRCKGKEGRAPATNLRRANTAKAQHILEISSQATLEAQMKQAQRSKSPPKPSSRKGKKNKKDETTENKPNKALPDVVPSETEVYDDVLPPPPRKPSKEKKRQGGLSLFRKTAESFRRSREKSPEKRPRRPSGEHSKKPEERPQRPPRRSDEKRRRAHDRLNSPDDRPKSPDDRPTSPDDRPTSPDNRPKRLDDRPTSPDNRPKSPDDRPKSPDDRPKSPHDRPTSPNDRQKRPDDRPKSPDDRPKRSDDKPRRSDNRPKSPEENRTRRSENDRPRTSGNTPRKSGDRKPEVKPRPRRSEDKPRTPEDRPSKPEDKPRRSEDRPRRPEDRPSGEVLRRAQGGRRRRPSEESSDKSPRSPGEQRNPLQLEEYRSIQLLESVISLSEEENINNNASYSQQDMTLDAKENNKQEETISSSSSTTQHYTKNPHRTSRDTDHVKPRNTVTFEEKEDSNDSEKENQHESVSQQNSDISRSYENFTLARKEGRPIYAVRTNYRACEDTEVDLIAEELVVVLEKTGTGWWYVQAQSGTGWAPNHFLKVPTGLMDENPKIAEEKQMKHLERLKNPAPAKSTCSAAHKQDQHAPKQTVRHVVKGRPKLIRDGIPATVCPSDFKADAPSDSDTDVGKSVSELKRMFSKWGKS